MEEVVQRGEIWWADLRKPRGSAPGYRRPVLVVQSDAFNRSAIPTVVVVALTTNLGLARAPGNVICRPRASGLPRPSVINVSQIATIDRRLLVEKVGRLSDSLMRAVDEGIRLVVGV